MPFSCDRTLDESNVRRKGYIFGSWFEGKTITVQKAWRQELIGWHLQGGEGATNAWAHFLLFMCPRIIAHGTVFPTDGMEVFCLN